MSRRIHSTHAWIPLLVFLLMGIQECLAQTGGDSTTEQDDATLVAFVNVGVVTMQDESVLMDQTVIIRGELIEVIGPAHAIAVPAEAMVIDAAGQYLIPGLADMHVHVRVPFEDGPLYLNAGITTVLSMGTRFPDLDAFLRERYLSRTTAFPVPTLYSTGPHIRGGESPDEVERIVRLSAEGGFDFVKVHGDVSPVAFDRLQDTAKILNIRVTGHAQRKQGMQPVYTHQQDLVHAEEYLYASFNPNTIGFRIASKACLFAMAFSLLMNVAWGLGAIKRRIQKRFSPGGSGGPGKSGGAGGSTEFNLVKKWFHHFTGFSWLFYLGYFLISPEPYMGVWAGKTWALALVSFLLLFVILATLVLTMRVWRISRSYGDANQNSGVLVFTLALAWIFVAGSGFLAPRIWRTSEAGLTRIAQRTKETGIWVTPNLVMLDYIKRHNTDEFHTLIQRPEMDYLRPEMRNTWINNNRYRVPPFMEPVQFAIWQSWTELMARLTLKLHEANVPLLAGSDAGGPPGVFPGSSLHEDLSLLVQAGLSPYEALKTATVNPAIYLKGEQEFGRIIPGYRADLVLLTGNPLQDITQTRTRVGVMKRGRWYAANELEAFLAELAQERK